MFQKSSRSFLRLDSVQECVAGILILSLTFFTSIGQPVPLFAQSVSQRTATAGVLPRPAATPVSSTATITIPHGIAASIGLGSAANFQISADAKWKDYEDILVLAVLNGIAKRAVNNGQTLTTAQYTAIGNQIRSWLDGKKPTNPVFVDEAAVLRYGIDALVPLINANPVNPLMVADETR
jgi:hypothetical protein